MKNLALIPARGGSRRIPRKNIREFLGKPIIAYTIEKALESGLFNEVMVSTDDEEIAEIAVGFGAKIPFMRSAESADDYATLADVVEEVRDRYMESGITFNYICCMLATAPMLRINDLVKGYKIVDEGEADSVRPVVRYPYPIQRALKLHDGKVELFRKEHAETRSQDLEPAYHDAAQFYWMPFEKGLRGSEKMGFEIPKHLAQDIDDEPDWKLAELKYRVFYQ